MTNALGKRFIAQGHKLLLNHSLDRGKLDAAARSMGSGTQIGSAADAVQFADIVCLRSAAMTFRGNCSSELARGEAVWSIVNPIKPTFLALQWAPRPRAAKRSPSRPGALWKRANAHGRYVTKC